LTDAGYARVAAPADVCAFDRTSSAGPVVRVVVPVRPTVRLPRELAPEGWTDVLAPLAELFGDQRPAVYVA
jgi:hypothetical protein